MSSISAEGATPTIRLRKGVDKVLRDVLECRSDEAVARRLGISHSQYSRIHRWKSNISLPFMARLLLTANAAAADHRRPLKPSDLFEIVTETGEAMPLCPDHMPWQRSA